MVVVEAVGVVGVVALAGMEVVCRDLVPALVSERLVTGGPALVPEGPVPGGPALVPEGPVPGGPALVPEGLVRGGPALVPEGPVPRDPELVRMEGELVVPGLPAGEGALCAVCTGLVTVPVLLLIPWNTNNTATVNTLPPEHLK